MDGGLWSLRGASSRRTIFQVERKAAYELLLTLIIAMMNIRLLISTLYRNYTTTLGASTTDDSMHQLGTLAAVPRGLRCELNLTKTKP